MCGIAGILASEPIEDIARQIELLWQTLSHRGPDDWGALTWNDGRAPDVGRSAKALAPGRLALIHRRLSIIDLSDLSWQPMGDQSGRHWIVFNGEIYNHLELRAELQAAGETFTSTGDTEILLTILKREGSKGLRRLVGMYAFAYLDLDRRRLLLVRDPFGIKPLFYHSSASCFSFASEIRPLIATGAATTAVDKAALFRFLRHGVTNYGGATVFADVRELAPGMLLDIDLDRPGEVKPQRFWQPSLVNSRSMKTSAEAVGELNALVRNSVALHMRADVPCAAALSGGVDSSGIVSIMRQRLGQSAPLDVFSYVADDEKLSELKWIEMEAARANARVHQVRLDPDALADEIDDLIRIQEQPFTTASMWAQAHIYRAAHASGFKIVLDGQGADEIFAGYGVFRAARLEGLIRDGQFGSAYALLRSLSSSRRGALLQAVGGFLPDGCRVLARHVVGKPVVSEWLDGGWFGPDAVEHRPELSPGCSPLKSALIDAVSGSSLPMLLRYADRSAMASSVENRVPYLTTDIAEFAFSLPDDILIGRDGTLKKVLREALRGIVPDDILDRRDKIGFETPENSWFAKHDSVRRIARETADLPLPPCFKPAVRQTMRALGSGEIGLNPDLWRIMMVIRWARCFDVTWDASPRLAQAAA